MSRLTRVQLAPLIDHTNLQPHAVQADIDQLCGEAVGHNFGAVCVHPGWVRYAAGRLIETPVRVCTVIGFPLGTQHPEAKQAEAQAALQDGADELDMVLNRRAVMARNENAVCADIDTVIRYADARRTKDGRDIVVKVILETGAPGMQTEEDIELACKAARKAGAHFVKTSSGFYFHNGRILGATEGHVALLKKYADGMQVKASGGLASYDDAMWAHVQGATRFGTSKGVQIIRSAPLN